MLGLDILCKDIYPNPSRDYLLTYAKQVAILIRILQTGTFNPLLRTAEILGSHLLTFNELAGTQKSNIMSGHQRDEFYDRDLPVICGRQPSFYSIDELRQILRHHRRRLLVRDTKSALLDILINLEKRLSDQSRGNIESWMRQSRYYKPSFADFVKPEGENDSDDDSQVSKRQKSSKKPERKASNNYIQDGTSMDVDDGSRIDCTVCLESLLKNEFPKHKITTRCEASTCSSCLTEAVESQISQKPWNQIECPECPELVPFEAVKEIVSEEAFERYANMLLSYLTCAALNIGEQI